MTVPIGSRNTARPGILSFYMKFLYGLLLFCGVSVLTWAGDIERGTILFTHAGTELTVIQRKFSLVSLVYKGYNPVIGLEWSGSGPSRDWSLQQDFLMGNVYFNNDAEEFFSAQGSWNQSFYSGKKSPWRFMAGYHFLWEIQKWQAPDYAYLWGIASVGISAGAAWKPAERDQLFLQFKIPALTLSRGTGEEGFHYQYSPVFRGQVAWLHRISGKWSVKADYGYSYSDEYFLVSRDRLGISLGYGPSW